MNTNVAAPGAAPILAALLAATLSAAGCAGQQSVRTDTTEARTATASATSSASTNGTGAMLAPMTPAERDALLGDIHDPAIVRAVERIRAATAAFRSLDRAVEAGYSGTVPNCLENPPAGGMGYHHANAELMDSTIELERPEILVYERTASRDYELTGVEYIVPISAWNRSAPPEAMGQKLKRSNALGIWYLHVWVWRPNSNGLFADWNPAITCRS